MKHLWSILAFAAVTTCHAANWYPIIVNGQVMTDYQPPTTVTNWVDPYYVNLAFLHNMQTTSTTYFVDAVGKDDARVMNSITNVFVGSNVVGRQEYAAYYNVASVHYLLLTNGTRFPNTGDFTLSAWVWPAVNWTAAVGGAMVYLEDSNGNQDTHLELRANLYPWFRSYSGSYQNTTGTIPCSVGTWTHLVVTRSGSTGAMWINGASNNSGNMQSTLASPRTNACLGMGKQNASLYSGYSGMIDDVRLYTNIALDATSISNLFLRTNPTNNIEQR